MSAKLDILTVYGGQFATLFFFINGQIMTAHCGHIKGRMVWKFLFSINP